MIASAWGRYSASSASSLARAMMIRAMSSRIADSIEVSSRKSAINTVKRSLIENPCIVIGLVVTPATERTPLVRNVRPGSFEPGGNVDPAPTQVLIVL